jgi:polysaccharide biosynthesis transport protein
MQENDKMPSGKGSKPGAADGSSSNGYAMNGNGADDARSSGTIMAHAREGLVLSRGGQVEPEAEQTTNYVRLVLHSLRGRYLLALASGIVWAGIFSAIAWNIAAPTYHSESLVRIANSLPKVMHETDQNAPMQMFDAFIMSQRLLITSRRVVDMAVQDPVWKQMGRAVPAAPDKYYADHLTVEIQHGSEFIRILVKDKEPGTPAAAVTAVTMAYQELFNQQEKTMERQRLGLLQDQQGTLNDRIVEYTKQLETKAKEYGTTDLSRFYDEMQTQIGKIDSALGDVDLALLGVAVATTQPSTTQPAGTVVLAGAAPANSAQAGAMLPEQIAQFDPQLRAALEEEAHDKDELDKLQRRGILDKNQLMKDLRDQIEGDKDRVRARVEVQENIRTQTGHYLGEPTAVAGGPGMNLLTSKTPEQLRADKANLSRLRTTAMKELVALGNKQMEFVKLKNDIATAKTDYEAVTLRMETLRTEEQLGSRLSIISTGEVALSPDTDPRLKIVPVAALAGMLFPIGCIVLVATLRGRVRYSDETESTIMPEIPFLGILPELDTNDIEGELSIAAAHSVHQIRVAIQSQDNDAEHRCYLITSATAGEGKTGLTMSLGLSYAASQLRTLVIDCDLVGRSLTSRLDAKGSPGLREAMAAGTMAGLCREMGNGLWVLTAGQGTSADAYTISSTKIRKLLDEARREFDIVIIDTGPILGSIEANILAPAVDGVILAVARGRARGMVRSALRKLNALGARPLGFVFNRAAATDFERSPYSSVTSTSIVSVRDIGATATRGENAAHLKDFGPLVQAMAGVDGKNGEQNAPDANADESSDG